MPDIEDFYNEIKGKKAVVGGDGGIEALYNEIKGNAPDYGTLPKNVQKFPELASVPVRQPTPVEGFQAGVARGLQDVPEAVGYGIAAVDPNTARSRLFKKNIEQKGLFGLGGSTPYQNKFGESEAAGIGRTTGQVIATAPLVPSTTIARVAGALPVTTATGSKISAPFVNRFASVVGQGAVGGGEFGALTSQTNDKSFGRNVGEGVITGALGAPVIAGASGLGGKVVQGVEGVWANVNASKIARAYGLPVSSVRKTIDKLEAAGLTPQEAQVELNKLGPKATISDLDEMLTGFARGIATTGDKAEAVMRGRFGARSDTANSDAVKIFTNKFGPKPDVMIEKGVVKGAEARFLKDEAERLTASDYRLAHNSTQKLDISGTVQHIDTALEDAVGKEAVKLKEVKGYLFRTDKDGNKTLKDDVRSLHKARRGIDDIINDQKDSLPPYALAAVTKVRELIDTQLKTNPEMLAADTKYAKHMELIKGLGFGHEAISKGLNKEEFARVFDAASPELKEKIKKGMLAGAHNMMEASTQGELTGASKIFDKKAVNRANFKHAFGQDADQVLDEVHRDLAFRNTEREIRFGSKTAQSQAVQQELGFRAKSPGALSEAAKGTTYDIIAGTPGVIAAGRGIMSFGRNKSVEYSENRFKQYVEGLGDIFSRSGAQRDVALGVAQRVKAVQDKLAASNKASIVRLPISASSPIGEETYEKGKNAVSRIRALIQ